MEPAEDLPGQPGGQGRHERRSDRAGCNQNTNAVHVCQRSSAPAINAPLQQKFRGGKLSKVTHKGELWFRGNECVVNVWEAVPVSVHRDSEGAVTRFFKTTVRLVV